MRTRSLAVAAPLVFAALAAMAARAQQPDSGSKLPNQPKQATASGTTHSERAPAGALQWLAKHQNKDGSWSFANLGRPGEPAWANPGTWTSKRGATGLVLLCYLSAGQTHTTRGPYRENIAAAAKMR